MLLRVLVLFYDFSKKLMDDRNKEKAKQDAEDKKIKDLVDGKKDPFKKLGEKDA